MTESKYEIGRYYEWTAGDRERGECPVPDGSDVTMWMDTRDLTRLPDPEKWEWGKDALWLVVGFLVHSYPKEPREVWVGFSPQGKPVTADESRDKAIEYTYGGSAAKFREVLE